MEFYIILVFCCTFLVAAIPAQAPARHATLASLICAGAARTYREPVWLLCVSAGGWAAALGTTTNNSPFLIQVTVFIGG